MDVFCDEKRWQRRGKKGDAVTIDVSAACRPFSWSSTPNRKQLRPHHHRSTTPTQLPLISLFVVYSRSKHFCLYTAVATTSVPLADVLPPLLILLLSICLCFSLHVLFACASMGGWASWYEGSLSACDALQVSKLLKAVYVAYEVS